MDERQQSLDTLKDIRSLMDKSSRFISLSGLSGVAAGTCALVGAWFAHGIIQNAIGAVGKFRHQYPLEPIGDFSIRGYVGGKLFMVACFTFAAAFLLAFLFTWQRSRKTGVPLFGVVSRRLTIAVGIPLIVGAFYVVKLMQYGAFGMIAPGCLLFYGLGLVNASRYTLGEIKYLGYCQLLLGIINLFFMGYGLYFWAFGFGILHIAYGIFMWNKYEREKIK
jgi:hypothetical protein